MKNTSFSKRAGLKDIWNGFMCEGTVYSKNDIPCCPTILHSLPAKIITWSEAKDIHKKSVIKDKDYFYDAIICFYIDDQKFDGIREGIWSNPFACLKIIEHFRGIITPDFSTYQDFPYPLKIYNTFRMRAFGYWIGKQGKEVVNNVRWGTPETYSYCFDGIERNSIVAIGTVGGSPSRIEDRVRFNNGLFEMVSRLHPKAIIVYGSSKYPCFDLLRKQGIDIYEYPSRTSEYFKEKKPHE